MEWTIEWNTGLSCFPCLDKFLCSFLEINKQLAIMDDCDNGNSCSLHRLKVMLYRHQISRAT